MFWTGLVIDMVYIVLGYVVHSKTSPKHTPNNTILSFTLWYYNTTLIRYNSTDISSNTTINIFTFILCLVNDKLSFIPGLASAATQVV